MELHTQRLKISPLTFNQLIKYLRSDNSLETELGLEVIPRIVPPVLVDAFTKTILPAVANEKNNYLFSTLWTVVLKEKNTMVGDLCFKGKPNEKGEIEIGYGTYESFQGKGYMTEAIGAIVKWAFSQQGVLSIIAETEKNNPASHRILEKNGFAQYKQSDQMIWWRVDKKDSTCNS